MAKNHDDVIVLRPGELVEIWDDVQVPCGEFAEWLRSNPLPALNAGEANFESSSVDRLEEFIGVQVPCDEPADAIPPKPLVQIPAKGKARAASSKKNKAKRRRK